MKKKDKIKAGISLGVLIGIILAVVYHVNRKNSAEESIQNYSEVN